MGRISKVLFVLIALIVVALLFGINMWALRATRPSNQDTSSAKEASSNVIFTENAQLGTTNWQIPSGDGASTEIQAYASATSISSGQTLTFYVSTKQSGMLYGISIYRLGWYNGLGGRLMDTEAGQFGIPQGYFDAGSNRLVGCNSCRVDTSTDLIEANWRPSYRLTVPSSWTTGVYLAKFTDANNKQTYVPFDVRGNEHSRYIVVTPDTTNEAYNNWGGGSLYASNGGATESNGEGVKVSFDRPYVQGFGSSDVLPFEVDAIHWLERQGYDLSYISNVDLHENPAQLLQHRAYLSIGHDEYWTKEMRDGVEHARDRGVGLAFLGANDSYWQMRFEPDSTGVADRTIVCYKVSSVQQNLTNDPLYGQDNSRLTTRWRDPILSRPENSLIGIMYSSLVTQYGFPWQLSLQVKSPLLNGTGLRPHVSYGCDLVGNEWDRIYANGETPAGLQVLGTSTTVDYVNQPDVSNTTYYIAPSGAMVFATGSIKWTAALDSYRYSIDPKCAGRQLVVPAMQKLLAHVMDALVVDHPSRQLALSTTT